MVDEGGGGRAGPTCTSSGPAAKSSEGRPLGSERRAARHSAMERPHVTMVARRDATTVTSMTRHHLGMGGGGKQSSLRGSSASSSSQSYSRGELPGLGRPRLPAAQHDGPEAPRRARDEVEPVDHDDDVAEDDAALREAREQWSSAPCPAAAFQTVPATSTHLECPVPVVGLHLDGTHEGRRLAAAAAGEVRPRRDPPPEALQRRRGTRWASDAIQGRPPFTPRLACCPLRTTSCTPTLRVASSSQ